MLTPQAAAEAYQARGYDFIAFTDHDYLLKPDYREVYARVQSEMLILHGIELTVFLKGYLHIGRIVGEKEELHVLNHLGEYGLVLEQLLDRIQGVADMFPLDAVEITSQGFRQREFETPAIAYPKIASDDLHALVGIGRAWIEVDAPTRAKDAIIQAIRHGDFWNGYL